jgi:hypothetical protein
LCAVCSSRGFLDDCRFSLGCYTLARFYKQNFLNGSVLDIYTLSFFLFPPIRAHL